MAMALPTAASRPAATGREFVALVAMLATFMAMPWLVRPLERWVSPVDAALIGQVTEIALGATLGAWVLRLIRQQRKLSIEHAREIERLTESDALTGLGNRRALARELELVLNRARRSCEAVSVLYLDIDAMDDVNHRYGRLIGDQTLRVMGGVLRSSVRFGVDTGYRIADDRFAIVLVASRDAGTLRNRRRSPRAGGRRR